MEVLEQDRAHRRRHRLEPLDDRVDHLVRDPRGEARQPVVERAFGIAGVEQGVHHRVGHRPHLDHDRRAPLEERREIGVGPVGIRMADQHSRHLHPRAVRRVHQRRKHRQLVRALLRRLPVEAQHVAAALDRVHDEPADDHRLVVQPERQRRGNAEVAPAAAQRPHQVGM